MRTIRFKAEALGYVAGKPFRFHAGDELEYVTEEPLSPSGYRFVYVGTPFGRACVILFGGTYEVSAVCPTCHGNGSIVVQDGPHPLDAHEEPCDSCGQLCPEHGDGRDTSVAACGPLTLE